MPRAACLLEASSLIQAGLAPRRLPRLMMAMTRGEKAAERNPADHCRENEPKLRVNNSIDSRVILP